MGELTLKFFPTRKAFTMFLVPIFLFIFTLFVFAHRMKSERETAWALRYYYERSAQEAALAGIAAAEDRLMQGRWYVTANPNKATGNFEISLNDRTTAFVVCEDVVRKASHPKGPIDSSLGKKGKVEIKGVGSFDSLHSVNVYSVGRCRESGQFALGGGKEIKRFAYAKFIISPEPIANGGAMEGVRIETEGGKNPYDDLVNAGLGGPKGGKFSIVTLPSRFTPDGFDQGLTTGMFKWKFQVPVSVGQKVSKGSTVISVSRDKSHGTIPAPHDGKVRSIFRASGEGEFDEPVLIVENESSFQSSGLTLKKMVRITPIPDDFSGTGNLMDKAGCRDVIRSYFNSQNQDYLRGYSRAFQQEASFPSPACLDDSQALGLVAPEEGKPDSEVGFVHRLLPQFIIPGLSAEERGQFLEQALVRLDKEKPKGPNDETRGIHEKRRGPFPTSPAVPDFLVLSPPRAISKALQKLHPDPSKDILSYSNGAGIFPNASYQYNWNAAEVLAMNTFPGVNFDDCFQYNGNAYKGFHDSGGWIDNAYDLEFKGKRIRLAEVALFLHKIVATGGDPPAGGEFAPFPDIDADPMVPGGPAANSKGGGGGA